MFMAGCCIGKTLAPSPRRDLSAPSTLPQMPSPPQRMTMTTMTLLQRRKRRTTPNRTVCVRRCFLSSYPLSCVHGKGEAWMVVWRRIGEGTQSRGTWLLDPSVP